MEPQNRVQNMIPVSCADPLHNQKYTSCTHHLNPQKREINTHELICMSMEQISMQLAYSNHISRKCTDQKMQRMKAVTALSKISYT